jgi:hypothetical protein
MLLFFIHDFTDQIFNNATNNQQFLASPLGAGGALDVWLEL